MNNKDNNGFKTGGYIHGNNRLIAINMIQYTDGFRRLCELSKFNPEEMKEAKVSLCQLGIKFECKNYSFITAPSEDDGLAYYIGDEAEIMKSLQGNSFWAHIEQYDDKVIIKHKPEPGCEYSILNKIKEISQWNVDIYLGTEDKEWLVSGLSEAEQFEKIAAYLRRKE